MNVSYHSNLKNPMDVCPSFCPGEDKPIKVMVYSHGGEPAILNAIGDLGDSILVFGDDAKKTLGYPRRFVFAFDGELFKRLLDAYTDESDLTIGELWGHARSV